MKTRKLGAYITLVLLFSLVTVQFAFADSDSSTGTATVGNATPTITLPELTTVAGADKNNTALSVATEYYANWTVGDGNTLADLANLTVHVWYGGAGGAAENDSDAQRNHYTFTWVESTDTWACPLAAAYIVDGDCADPGTASASTSYEFRLAFKLSKVANYSNGADYSGWHIKAYVYDDANAGAGIQQLQFGVASFFDIAITDTTHAWSVNANTNDNVVSAGGDGKVDFTVVANTIWKAQVQSDRAALNGTVGTINVANVTQYGTDVVGSSVALTTSYVDVTGITSQAAPTDEAAPTTKGVYIWLDVPAGTPTGAYVYILNIQAVVQP